MSGQALMAVVLIEPRLLNELLQLPAEAEVVHVAADHERRGCLKVVLRGVGWPTQPGDVIPLCVPAVTVTRHVASIDWGLPT